MGQSHYNRVCIKILYSFALRQNIKNIKTYKGFFSINFYSSRIASATFNCFVDLTSIWILTTNSIYQFFFPYSTLTIIIQALKQLLIQNWCWLFIFYFFLSILFANSFNSFLLVKFLLIRFQRSWNKGCAYWKNSIDYLWSILIFKNKHGKIYGA